ncbi:hypothetical protein QYE76_044505 [Lolium multiflorum]|uniref:Uncharacterized protein n=1 Tax=Lolium multiflorum TaxID=4521 RepID=A0AAD8WWL9_LOLMU|nr:hypothetical protein QYE76_044505 [Lolium multiflorum]
MGTFETLDLTARAYDTMVWRLDSPHGPVNSPNVQTRRSQVMRRDEEHQVRLEYMLMSIRQVDEAAMAEFRAAHQEHLAAEMEFYAALATKQASTSVAFVASSSTASPGSSTSAATVALQSLFTTSRQARRWTLTSRSPLFVRPTWNRRMTGSGMTSV